MPAQDRRYFATLPQIQTLEWLIDQEHRLWHKQADREQYPFTLAFGKRTDARPQEGAQFEIANDALEKVSSPAKEAETELQGPIDRLVGPGPNAIWDVK